MRKKIDRLAIKGFKSIRNLSNFPLGDINVVARRAREGGGMKLGAGEIRRIKKSAFEVGGRKRESHG